MKSIILKDFEVKRLSSSGSVLIWRRVKPKTVSIGDAWYKASDAIESVHHCPFGRSGETRWVKEGWCLVTNSDGTKRIDYRATMTPQEFSGLVRWSPSCHLREPHSRFRVTLSVSCRQIQSVTEEEAERSGVSSICPFNVCSGSGYLGGDNNCQCADMNPQEVLKSTIESRHPGSWERNDWFWSIECKEVKL